MSFNEQEILAKLQDPSTRRRAFAEVVNQYSETLYWQIRRMVVDHEDANDVLQNTLVKAWTSIGSFRGEAKLSTWLFRIAYHESLTFLEHKKQNKERTVEEKYELVVKVLGGQSIKTTAIEAGISRGLLYQWVKRYRIEGYEGLATMKKGRPPKEAPMKKKELPAELTPSEREEMIRLRAENEYLRAENAVIKKEIALREERWAAQLKARKQCSSKNSGKKDIP